MNNIILDASAVLAFLDDEPGCDQVDAVLRSAVVGTVNLAEVYTKLEERGIDSTTPVTAIRDAVREVIALTAEQAALIGQLRPLTRHLGLSLGDRACLALGVHLGGTVYTTDREWLKLTLPCTIHCIR